MPETDDRGRLHRLIADGRARPAEPSLPGSDGAPFPALDQLLRRYGPGGDAPAVLILGDSVSVRISHDDRDRRPLHRMIADMLAVPSLAIAGSAFQGVLFRDLMRALSVLPRRPSLVVIPVNLRSCSAQWHSNPLWEMRQEREIIARFVEDPRTPIPPVETVTAGPGFFERYDASAARSTLSELSSNGEFRALSLARPSDERDAAIRYRELFAWHYGFDLSEDHAKLSALAETIATAAAFGSRVVAYLTPINAELGTELLGGRFAERLDRTAEVVRTRLSTAMADSRRHALLDLRDYLGSRFFFHKNLATEHLAETGRGKLARAVAAEATRLLGA